MTDRIVIASGVRTPVGRYMGGLRSVEAYDLASLVLNEAISRAGIEPEQIDEVIMGQTYQNGEYVNIARMALLNAGWPEELPGLTIDRRCCTGLEVIRLAASLIRSGDAEIVVAGGVESMSNAEFYLPGKIKWGIGGEKGIPRGHGDLSIWGLPFYDRIQRARVMSQPEHRYGLLPSMMSWAETAAVEENITREACDQWAYESQIKACSAWDRGKFDEEVVPVEVPQRKGDPVIVSTDETLRRDTSMEKLARLTPVQGGVCTAGNSSSENDGAAAVVVMSEQKARDLGIKAFMSVNAIAVAGADPTRTHLTVGRAVRKALGMSQIPLGRIDLIEIQEAFAAQVLADLKDMGIPPDNYDRVNVNGSGISLGHPIGATGTRVLVTLMHEMQRRDAKIGLECICGGGGLGIAGVFERGK
ncbi:MAG: acetyl-CoA C-acyltransferase [Desulfobacterales bacterium]|nr:acetyl-CoA C-acyltransferase [Desulfobacterales bacterium]